MNVFFSVSSKENIDKKYIESVDEISYQIAKDNNDLIIGVAEDEGMPGKVLNNFRLFNRQIYLKTLKIYKEDPIKFNYVNFEYVNSTIARTKKIYESSDLLLFNPGGFGTFAEIFSFIEELKTNKDKKVLLLYNQNNYYDKLLELIKHTIETRFGDSSIYQYLQVFNDKDELINFINNYKGEQKILKK